MYHMIHVIRVITCEISKKDTCVISKKDTNELVYKTETGSLI